MSATAIKLAVTRLIASPTTMPTVPYPRTTLAADAHAGDTSVTIVPSLDTLGRPRFVGQGRFGVYDATNEPMITIADSGVTTDGATITFKTSDPATFTGLLHDHPAGTVVYTNLLPYGPFDGSPMLYLDDPVIFVTATRRRANVNVMPLAGWPVYEVIVQSHRMLTRLDDSSDAESWTQRHEDGSMDEMEAIGLMLAKNQELITEFTTAAAQKFAPLNQSNDVVVIDWAPQKYPVTDNWHYVGTATMLVLGLADTMR
jgi:hypothetical protein